MPTVPRKSTAADAFLAEIYQRATFKQFHRSEGRTYADTLLSPNGRAARCHW